MKLTTPRRLLVVAASALALVLGAGAAIAATGGPGNGLKGAAQAIAGKAQHKEALAKELGTTVAKLEAAAETAALARIDAALKAGEITAAEATSLKTALEEQPGFARRIALPADVAKALGVTEAKLQAAHLAVHKAQATARVDQALADGKITKEYADQLKKQIDETTALGKGMGPGFGKRGGHGSGPGFGPGPGMGPGAGAQGPAQPAGLVF